MKGIVRLGINLEFVRSHDMSFLRGVKKASEIGFEYIGINFDTGNSYLAGGSDVYKWLGSVKDRLVHLHAKDISLSQSTSERGKVSGTPVGCACGDGVVDWKRVIDIVKSSGKEIVFSVECGSIEQAIRSFEHLTPLL